MDFFGFPFSFFFFFFFFPPSFVMHIGSRRAFPARSLESAGDSPPPFLPFFSPPSSFVEAQGACSGKEGEVGNRPFFPPFPPPPFFFFFFFFLLFFPFLRGAGRCLVEKAVPNCALFLFSLFSFFSLFFFLPRSELSFGNELGIFFPFPFFFSFPFPYVSGHYVAQNAGRAFPFFFFFPPLFFFSRLFSTRTTRELKLYRHGSAPLFFFPLSFFPPFLFFFPFRETAILEDRTMHTIVLPSSFLFFFFSFPQSFPSQWKQT